MRENGPKGLNRALDDVAAMHVGWYELEGCVSLLGNLLFVGSVVLVVEYLEISAVAILLEADHDAVGSSKAVAVVLGLEGLDHDDVGVAVVGEHDVLVAAARADGEAAHVVGVKFADVVDSNKKFF